MVAILVVAYLAFFSAPEVWRSLVWLVPNIAAGNLAGIGLGVGRLALQLFDLFIWLASVDLAAEGLLVARKKAYAFLLGYLLLCTIAAPVSYFGNRFAQIQQQRNWAQQARPPAAFSKALPVEAERYATVTSTLGLPIGPLLLLVAIWFFCQADGVQRRMESEQTDLGKTG